MPLNLVEADGIHKVLGPDEQQELPHVHLGDEHPVEARDDLAEVFRERVEMSQVNGGYRGPPRLEDADGRGDGSVCASPTDDEQLARFLPHDFRRGNVFGDARDFCRADPDHVLVVGRLVAEGARSVLLLDSADPVLQSRCSGFRPGPREGLRVPEVGQESFRIGAELDFQLRQALHSGDAPGLGPVGQIAVGEQDHRRHVLEGNPGGLNRREEAIARGGGGHHGDGRIAVPAVKDLEEVGLLGLGGKPRAGAAALDVQDDQGELGHHR